MGIISLMPYAMCRHRRLAGHKEQLPVLSCARAGRGTLSLPRQNAAPQRIPARTSLSQVLEQRGAAEHVFGWDERVHLRLYQSTCAAAGSRARRVGGAAVRRERQSKERGVLTHDVADRRDWTRTPSLLQPPKGRRGNIKHCKISCLALKQKCIQPRSI